MSITFYLLLQRSRNSCYTLKRLFKEIYRSPLSLEFYCVQSKLEKFLTFRYKMHWSIHWFKLCQQNRPNRNTIHLQSTFKFSDKHYWTAHLPSSFVVTFLENINKKHPAIISFFRIRVQAFRILMQMQPKPDEFFSHKIPVLNYAHLSNRISKFKSRFERNEGKKRIESERCKARKARAE